MRPLFGVLVFASLAACKAEPVEAGPPAELAAAPAQASPVVAVVPVPASEPPAQVIPSPVQGITYATFDKSRLDDCNDSRIEPSAGNEAAATESLKHVATKVDALIKGWKGADKPVVLGKRCSEQFPDRIVFATCEIDRVAELGRTTITIHYYNLQTLEASDLAMKSCLESKGNWRANTNRSAVDAERRRNTRRKLETMLADAEAAAK